MVAPSSIAASKSWLMPIDSSASCAAGSPGDQLVAERAQAREHTAAPRPDRRRTAATIISPVTQTARPSASGPAHDARPPPAGAELGGFAGEVDLDEELRLPPALGRRVVQRAQQIERIDGVDRVERPAGLARLVRLQVADQVPAKVGAPAASASILGSASWTRFSPKSRWPACDRGADGVDPERLGDGDEPDRVRGPAAAPRRRGRCAPAPPRGWRR